MGFIRSFMGLISGSCDGWVGDSCRVVSKYEK